MECSLVVVDGDLIVCTGPGDFSLGLPEDSIGENSFCWSLLKLGEMRIAPEVGSEKSSRHFVEEASCNKLRWQDKWDLIPCTAPTIHGINGSSRSVIKSFLKPMLIVASQELYILQTRVAEIWFPRKFEEGFATK